MSDIKILIGADIKELEQKLAVAKAKLAEMGGVAQKAGTGVNALGGVAQNAARQIGGLTTSLISGGLFTALTLVGVALFEVGKRMFGATEQSKKLAEEQANIAKSFKEAADSVGEEISKVTLLTSVLQSENTTRLQKAEALKQLKKINYDYFGQLDIENEKVKGLEVVYDAYVTKLLRSITAKANVDLLTEALKKQAEVVAVINQNQAKGFEKFTANNLTQFQILKAIGDFNLDFGAKGGDKTFLDLDKLQLIADLLNAQEKVKAITQNIRGTVQDVFNGKEIKTPTIKIKPTNVQIELPEKSSILPQSTDKTVNRTTGATLTPTIEIKPKFEVKIDPAESDRVLKKMYAMFDRDKLAVFQKDATDAINETIFNIANDSISTAATAIGEAISGNKDALPNLFGTLIKGIGGQVKDLGKYLVEIGLEMLGAKKAIEALSISPQAAIIAGIGLQVLGSILSASFTKKSKNSFATGVRNFSGGVAMVGERGPERVFLPSGSSVQPNNEMTAYGGGRETFIPAVTLSGSDLVIAFNRASQQMSRNS